jgi:hypothetical protein
VTLRLRIARSTLAVVLMALAACGGSGSSGAPARGTTTAADLPAYSLAQIRAAFRAAGVATTVERSDTPCTPPRNGECGSYTIGPKGGPRGYAVVLPKTDGPRADFVVLVYRSSRDAAGVAGPTTDPILGRPLRSVRKRNIWAVYYRSHLPAGLKRALSRLH